MDWGSSITYLAEARVKGQWTRFGVKDADRLSHLCLVGKTGTGKPAFVAHMALQDVSREMGVVVLDGTGNLSQTLLERLPEDARGRLIALDPSDGEHPYSWNALDDFRLLAPEAALPLLSKALASVYQIPEGPLVEFAALYMLAHKDATFLFLYEAVADLKTRERIFPQKTQEREKLEALVVQSADAVSQINEKGKYLAKDVLVRNLLGQSASKLSLSALKKGSIVVVDFSRIRMFPTRITPLVRLFLFAALAQAGPETPLAVYVHDCLRYLSPEDLERALLSPNAALAVSDTAHGEEVSAVRAKMLQRAGSVFAFLPHESDLPLVARVFYPYVAPEELEKLEDGHLIVGLTIDSVRSRPFFARALPLPERTGMSHLDLWLASRSTYTGQRLAIDKLFTQKPKEKEEEEKEKKAEEPGSFSGAFRSIFTKRAGADAGDKKTKPAAPAGGAAAPSTKPPDAKTMKVNEKEKKVDGIKPAEIPEEKLKKMIHVKHKPS